MNTSTIYTGLGIFVCFLATVTLTYTSQLEDIADDPAESFPPNMRYILNNMKNYDIGLQAPPHAYMNKLKRYLHEAKTKRHTGIWVWMPAQGYVPVQPADRSTETKSSSSGSVLRYG